MSVLNLKRGWSWKVINSSEKMKVQLVRKVLWVYPIVLMEREVPEGHYISTLNSMLEVARNEGIY